MNSQLLEATYRNVSMTHTLRNLVLESYNLLGNLNTSKYMFFNNCI